MKTSPFNLTFVCASNNDKARVTARMQRQFPCKNEDGRRMTPVLLDGATRSLRRSKW